MGGRDWVHWHDNKAAITQKTQALAVMGQRSLLMPGWIKAALAATDHLKLYLTVLQATARFMPARPAPSSSR
jgi:hypothetical protein